MRAGPINISLPSRRCLVLALVSSRFCCGGPRRYSTTHSAAAAAQARFHADGGLGRKAFVEICRLAEEVAGVLWA